MRKKVYPITEKNKKQLDLFLNSLKAEYSPDDDTIRTYENSIRRTLCETGIDISKITVKNQDKLKPVIDKFFANFPPESKGTKELIKMKFRVFLRYKKLCRLAEHIKIDSSIFKRKTKGDNDVLTPKEIELIRCSTNSNRDLAMFELFITTGIRREELTTLKIQNIEVLEDEIKVKVTKSKTKPRTVSIIPYPGNPIAFFPEHFVSYFRNHPFRDNPGFPLFYSTDYRKPNTAFEEHAINQIIHKVQKRAGVTKNITPHILRHTASTYDGHHLTEPNIVLKYAHSPDVARRYCHINEEQFSSFLKQKAGLTPQVVEKESKCPYCGHVNNIHDINCVNCRRIISRDELIKQSLLTEQREKARDEQISKLEDKINSIERSVEKYTDPINPETIKEVDLVSSALAEFSELPKEQIKDFMNKGLANLQKSDKKELIDDVGRKDYASLIKKIMDTK